MSASGLKSYAIILFAGSDGSSWLTDMLGNHPSAFHAVFEPFQDVHGLSDAEKKQALAALFEGDAGAAQAVLPRLGVEDVGVWLDTWRQAKLILFKIRPGELSDETLASLARAYKVHFIYLTRQNRIKQAVSHLRRTMHGVNHFETSTVQPAKPIPPADIQEWAENFRYQEDLRQDFLTRENLPYLHLTYERLLADRDGILRRLLNYVGLPWNESARNSFYGKVTSDRLEEAVVNYEEIRAFFANTPYENDLGSSQPVS